MEFCSNIFLMAVLQLVSSVKQGEFMKAIRVKPFAPDRMAELEKHVARQPTLASLGTIPPWMHLLERSGCTDPAVFEQQIVATRLRMYVDEWIDTGVTPNVGEVPLKRDLARAPAAAKMLRDYVEQHRPRLASSPKRRELVFEMCQPGTDEDVAWRRRGRFDRVCRAFEEADRLFAGLMLSEWGQRLCRCRYSVCGQYFLKESLRPAPLVHGAFCSPAHQRKASAGDCVRKSRARHRRQLIEKAAAFLVRWRIASPPWQQDRNRKLLLASALSATQLCQRHRLVLTSNWVTRHCQPIEKRRLQLTSK
jgi:hypothetical protein